MVTVDTEYHGLGGPELPAIYQALAKLWQAAHPMHYAAKFKTYFAFNRMIAAWGSLRFFDPPTSSTVVGST
ncbi:hypothetical protein SAMN05428952_104120 [Nitrosomonas sp. Nm132]|jgi:hypothetical protein|nr:hypothetical protein SAMN05428952_104120 [Nitrosomonas sp. Nm132]SDZ09735.1 hypothetical protein SAMN05421754_10587 [Nitrosomonas sp. Nm58]